LEIGDALVAELDRALSEIAEHPHRWKRIVENIHSYGPTKKFKWRIVYVEQAREIFRHRRVLQRRGRPALLDRTPGFLSACRSFPPMLRPKGGKLFAGAALDGSSLDFVRAS
jgi:hypothetical protein